MITFLMQIPYTAWYQHSHCCVPVATAFEVSSAGINVHDKKEAPAESGSTHRVFAKMQVATTVNQ